MKTYQKLNKFLEERGIKQKFISDKTGIPENILSMILNGKRKMDVEEFVEIILALNVDANYFIQPVFEGIKGRSE